MQGRHSTLVSLKARLLEASNNLPLHTSKPQHVIPLLEINSNIPFTEGQENADAHREIPQWYIHFFTVLLFFIVNKFDVCTRGPAGFRGRPIG